MTRRILSALGAALGVALGAFALTFIGAPQPLEAQSGQMNSGQIWGNPTTGQNLARPTTLSSIADIAFSPTQGVVPLRGATQWSVWLGTSGGVPFFDTTQTLTSSALLAQYGVVYGGGAGTGPSAITTPGTAKLFLHGNASGPPFFKSADFTNDLFTGTLTTGLLDVATASQWYANTANKVLTTDQMWASGTLKNLTHGTNVTVDMSFGVDFIWTITSTPTTLLSPSNAKVGQKGLIYQVMGVTGGTITYGNSWKFANGLAPTPSTTNGSVDILSYVCRTATFCAVTRGADFR